MAQMEAQKDHANGFSTVTPIRVEFRCDTLPGPDGCLSKARAFDG